VSPTGLKQRSLQYARGWPIPAEAGATEANTVSWRSCYNLCNGESTYKSKNDGKLPAVDNRQKWYLLVLPKFWKHFYFGKKNEVCATKE
jgi:hypothetical protein